MFVHNKRTMRRVVAQAEHGAVAHPVPAGDLRGRVRRLGQGATSHFRPQSFVEGLAGAAPALVWTRGG